MATTESSVKEWKKQSEKTRQQNNRMDFGQALSRFPALYVDACVERVNQRLEKIPAEKVIKSIFYFPRTARR